MIGKVKWFTVRSTKIVSGVSLVRHDGQKDHEQISGSREQSIIGNELNSFLATERIRDFSGSIDHLRWQFFTNFHPPIFTSFHPHLLEQVLNCACRGGFRRLGIS
jgi:hypothetical protein